VILRRRARRAKPSPVLPDTVLLVDDEPIVLDVLTQALGKKDLTVTVATRVSEAAELLRTRAFGCMLVDKNLPDGDGISLIRLARELQPYCACIVMTGYPNVASIVEALRLGAVDYLEKPFPQLSIVQEKVRASLDRQKLVEEREVLHQRIRALQQQQPEAFKESAELVMLQQALEVAKENAARTIGELRVSKDREVASLTGRLETVKARHGKMLHALRDAANELRATLEAGGLPQAAEGQLREIRRKLTAALDEP